MSGERRAAVLLPALVLVVTLAELVAAVVVPARPVRRQGLGRPAGRLPGADAAAPALWWLGRGRAAPRPPPYAAFALIMLPVPLDTTANWLDLFREVGWWDDLSHFAHWFLLGAGHRAAARARTSGRAGSLVPLVGGAGAVLALGWELGEYALFIRHGKEAGGAYRDTLGDQTLGTSGALLAGCWSPGGAARRRLREPSPVEGSTGPDPRRTVEGDPVPALGRGRARHAAAGRGPASRCTCCRPRTATSARPAARRRCAAREGPALVRVRRDRRHPAAARRRPVQRRRRAVRRAHPDAGVVAGRPTTGASTSCCSPARPTWSTTARPPLSGTTSTLDATLSRDPGIRLPRTADLLPPELAERLLRGVDDDDVEPGAGPAGGRRQRARAAAGAGRPTCPASTTSTCGLDPDTGVPLRVEVYAAGADRRPSPARSATSRADRPSARRGRLRAAAPASTSTSTTCSTSPTPPTSTRPCRPPDTRRRAGEDRVVRRRRRRLRRAG